MALDFYIACSIDTIQQTDVPVEMSEELHEYIYQNKETVDFDLRCLYELDQYGDTVLRIERVGLIVDVCTKILGSNLFSRFSNTDEAVMTITRLKEMCERAIANNQSLISVGD